MRKDQSDNKADVRRDLDLSTATWTKASSGDTTPEDVIEYAHVLHTDGVTYTAMRQPSDSADTVLIFTPSEWDAFVKGVKDGEFDLPDTTAP